MVGTSRDPHKGLKRELVVGIDIGTTFSGVSYSILEPGQVPEIKHVTRFPAAHDRSGGNSKIPSQIWYDSCGIPQAFGAEADEPATVYRALEEQWTKVEWFKLFMTKSETVKERLPPLPGAKDITTIWADFLRYLVDCTKNFIRETHFNGDEIWNEAMNGSGKFILTHPNAWDGGQQSKLREAAISAGIVPDTPSGRACIKFVTEGEASLHFCLQQGIDDRLVQAGKGILIIDAGGGTIDLSAYTPVSHKGRTGFSEIATPRCQLDGAVFVSQFARKALAKKLASSKFASDIDEIVRCFDQSTKLTFRNAADSAFIKFGSLRDNDPSVGIKHGQMKLTGNEVAAFFNPSIQAIIGAVSAIGFSASEGIKSAFLVGGFAASDWLFQRLYLHFKPLGIEIFRPDTHINKAVSDGAVGYHIDHQVSIRISRYHYGIECGVIFDNRKADHAKRESKKYETLDGVIRVPGAFDIILHKNVKVHETTEFRCTYCHNWDHRPLPHEEFATRVLQYCGTKENPEWIDEGTDDFLTLCSVVIDGRSASALATTAVNPCGNIYYNIQFDVVLKFGLTELEAQMAWVENGVEKRGSAAIVYTNDEPAIAYTNFQRSEIDDEGTKVSGDEDTQDPWL